jgi:hypothetical protein
MRELLIKWLNEGIAMQSGEELYIPTDSAAYQKDLYNLLRKELCILRSIDAENAAKLRIYTVYKDRQFWVVIKKINVTPLVAFKKTAEGVISRVTISNEKEKQRLVRLKEADHVKKTSV